MHHGNTTQERSADRMEMAMMKKQRMGRWMGAAAGCVVLAMVGCNSGETFPTIYTLTANTSTPSTGVTLNVSPSDLNGNGNGSARFRLKASRRCRLIGSKLGRGFAPDRAAYRATRRASPDRAFRLAVWASP